MVACHARELRGGDGYISSMKVAGLFAGVGGIELGLSREGFEPLVLCEFDPAAQAVLGAQYPEVRSPVTCGK